MTTPCVHFCAKHIRPFDVVSGDGFIEVANVLISLGACYGQVDACADLPSPTTVSRKVADVAETMQGKIVPEIQAAMAEHLCAVTTDMWIDNYKKRSYITATVHYIDDEWNLHSTVLFTCDFQSERKTGVNIRQELHRRFEKAGIGKELLHNAIFVTDQGANIVNALQCYTRFDCSAHVLNTVLRNTFNSDFLEKEAPDLKEAIDLTKATVTYLKQTGLASQLKHTVGQEVPTRWNSKLHMLKSVYEQFEDIQSLLDTRSCLLLQQVSKRILKVLVDFLQPFKDATDSLERDKSPSLLLVVLHVAKLRKHLREDAWTEAQLSKIRKCAESFLESKMKVGMLHKVATFLLPQFRQLRMIPEEEHEEVYEHVRDALTDMQATPFEKDTAGIEPTAAEPGSSAKRGHVDVEFEEWRDTDDGPSTTYEVDEYLRCGPSVVDDSQPDCILRWWRNKQRDMPKLAAYAGRVLCVSASSASTERNFSAAGHVLQKRRTCLKPASVDNLVFLHKNL